MFFLYLPVQFYSNISYHKLKSDIKLLSMLFSNIKKSGGILYYIYFTAAFKNISKKVGSAFVNSFIFTLRTEFLTACSFIQRTCFMFNYVGTTAD